MPHLAERGRRCKLRWGRHTVARESQTGPPTDRSTSLSVEPRLPQPTRTNRILVVAAWLSGAHFLG